MEQNFMDDVIKKIMEETRKGENCMPRAFKIIDKFLEDTKDFPDCAVYSTIAMIIEEHCKRINMDKMKFVDILNDDFGGTK